MKKKRKKQLTDLQKQVAARMGNLKAEQEKKEAEQRKNLDKLAAKLRRERDAKQQAIEDKRLAANAERERAASVERERVAKEKALSAWLLAGGSRELFETEWPEIYKQNLIAQAVQAASTARETIKIRF